MASIGYNKGFYGRSKWNELAIQATSTIAATTSGAGTLTQVHVETAVIAATSGFSAEGTQIDKATATIQAVSGFNAQGTQISLKALSTIFVPVLAISAGS